jgi:type IV pilus assembly protein PilM
MLFMKSRDIVGIDIGSSSVKLVQLSEQKGSYSLKNAGILPLPSEAIVDNSLMDTSLLLRQFATRLKVWDPRWWMLARFRVIR